MLPQQLKSIEKNNYLLFQIGKGSRYLVNYFQNTEYMRKARKRSSGYYDVRYSKLKTLKDSQKGKRCFIIATGPSLTIHDVELLKNEYTIGMNSICLLYEKTEWRASLYGIQDADVYEKVKDTISKYPNNVLISDNIASKYNLKNVDQFPLNYYYNHFEYRYSDTLKVKFSSDAYSVVYDAYSITFSLMQIAIYMGFTEIYLLGCDCNQKVGQKNHFIENGHVEDSTKLATSAERNIFSHQEIKKYCDSIGVSVFNATRGGALEVYPRVNLEDVIALRSK